MNFYEQRIKTNHRKGDVQADKSKNLEKYEISADVKARDGLFFFQNSLQHHQIYKHRKEVDAWERKKNSLSNLRFTPSDNTTNKAKRG